MPRKNLRRAASKEALKQMQLLSASAYEDDDNETETFEITSDDDVLYNIICLVYFLVVTLMNHL